LPLRLFASVDQLGLKLEAKKEPVETPITIPNYNRKTNRHQFGTLIGITSES